MKRIRVVIEIEDDDGCVSVNERSHVDSAEMPLNTAMIGCVIASAIDVLPRRVASLAEALLGVEESCDGDELGMFVGLMDAADRYCDYWDDFDKANGR